MGVRKNDPTDPALILPQKRKGGSTIPKSKQRLTSSRSYLPTLNEQQYRKERPGVAVQAGRESLTDQAGRQDQSDLTSMPANGKHDPPTSKQGRIVAGSTGSLVLTVPIRTHTMNLAENGFARWKRRKMQRSAVHMLWPRGFRGQPPYLVHLVRISPAGKFLDPDNLQGALKSAVDQVAQELGVDDGDTARIRFTYASERGPWGVRIEVTT